MSVHEIKANTNAADNAFQQRTEELSYSGGLHDQAIKSQGHASPDGMQGELNRLRADAINEQSQGSRTPGLPQSLARANLIKEQRKTARNGTLDSGSAQNDLHHRNAPASDKQAMRRWHAETAAEQPWNSFHHVTDAQHRG